MTEEKIEEKKEPKTVGINFPFVFPVIICKTCSRQFVLISVHEIPNCQIEEHSYHCPYCGEKQL